MIAILRETAKGLTPNAARILDSLLKDKHMLFVGYSGNDFDNYPKILSMADAAKGRKGAAFTEVTVRGAVTGRADCVC